MDYSVLLTKERNRCYPFCEYWEISLPWLVTFAEHGDHFEKYLFKSKIVLSTINTDIAGKDDRHTEFLNCHFFGNNG